MTYARSSYYYYNVYLLGHTCCGNFDMMLLMNMSQTYFNSGYVRIAQVYVLSWCVFVSNSDCTFSINSLYTNYSSFWFDTINWG